MHPEADKELHNQLDNYFYEQRQDHYDHPKD